jgi:hypothetical protein
MGMSLPLPLHSLAPWPMQKDMAMRKRHVRRWPRPIHDLPKGRWERRAGGRRRNPDFPLLPPVRRAAGMPMTMPMMYANAASRPDGRYVHT